MSRSTATVVPAAPAVVFGRTPSYGELACRSHDPELFFAEKPREVELAKRVCAGCPARATCLHEALERQEPWGVWGGALFHDGFVIEYKRARGRPRKDAAA